MADIDKAIGASSVPQQESNEGVSVVQEIKWDEEFNDPKADIILVSKEGIRFRLSSFHAKSKSGYIADLLALPSSTSIDESPMSTACPAQSLRVFCRLIYSDMTGLLKDLKVSDLFELLNICDFLQADGIQEAARAELVSRNKIDPTDAWKVFVWACRKDEMGLARVAIRVFPSDCPASKIPDVQVEDVEDLPIKYLLGLMRLRLIALSGGWSIKEPARYITVPWDEVGRYFMSPKPQRATSSATAAGILKRVRDPLVVARRPAHATFRPY